MAHPSTTTAKDSLSRRQALAAGTGVAVIVAGPAAAAAEDPDRPKWIAMWELFVDLDAKHSIAANSGDEAADRAACEASIALEREIASTPATSVIAFAVKLAIARRLGDLDDFVEHGTLQAAYRDTMRLAGLPEAFGELEGMS